MSVKFVLCDVCNVYKVLGKSLGDSFSIGFLMVSGIIHDRK